MSLEKIVTIVWGILIIGLVVVFTNSGNYTAVLYIMLTVFSGFVLKLCKYQGR